MLAYFQGNIVHITKEVYLVAPFKQSQDIFVYIWKIDLTMWTFHVALHDMSFLDKLTTFASPGCTTLHAEIHSKSTNRRRSPILRLYPTLLYLSNGAKPN